MSRSSITLLFTILTCASIPLAHSVPLRIHVQDGGWEALKDQLVIVQPLENYGEIFRALTDENGNIAPRDLNSGFYRVIVTNPYGLWETRIQEFAITSEPETLVLTVEPMPTHGFGDRVPIRSEPPRTLTVQFVDEGGKPVPDVQFLVRNEDLDFAAWYISDGKGMKKVELPDEPITLVALWKGSLTIRAFDNKFVDQLHGKHFVISLR